MSVYLTRQMLDPTSRHSQPHLFERLFGRWRTAVTTWRQQRRMMEKLRSMDDRLLSDIGLKRGEIPNLTGQLAALEHPISPLASASANWAEPENARMAA